MNKLTATEEWAMRGIQDGGAPAWILQQCPTAIYFTKYDEKKHIILKDFFSPNGYKFYIIRDKPMKNFIQIGDQKIKISEETAAEFLKQFGGKTRWEAVKEYVSKEDFKYTSVSYKKPFIHFSLPERNVDWTFEVWKFIQKLCDNFNFVAPRHKSLCHDNYQRIEMLDHNKIYKG